MISMSASQREKRIIQKRQQTERFAFSILLLIAFLVPASIFVAVPHIAWPFALLISCWAPLLIPGLFLLILILGISIIGPFMQETQHQKQNWLNEYGVHIHAIATKHPEKDAIVIGERGNKHTFYDVYLNWQDPQTGQLYSFCVNSRFSSALRNLSKGEMYPVQFDPDDLSFCDVPL